MSRVNKFHVISVIVYGSECWAMSSQTIGVTWADWNIFLLKDTKNTMKLPWEKWGCLKENGSKIIKPRITKRPLKYLGYIKRGMRA